MIERTEELIGALREELQQYGEMLARLDQQQEFVLLRDADQVLHSAGAVAAQGAVIQEARERRERLQRDLAWTFGLSEAAAFTDLIPRLPSDYRPLVEALVQENNDLLRRVRERASQNHLLLSRSVELMQQLVSALVPNSNPPLYNGYGKMERAPGPAQALYSEVG
jgi:flagellar biosynthesis/type III secretory pathway chaperone